MITQQQTSVEAFAAAFFDMIRANQRMGLSICLAHMESFALIAGFWSIPRASRVIDHIETSWGGGHEVIHVTFKGSLNL